MLKGPPDLPDRLPKKKSRLQDIAELTGLGIATVDRVLNERGNVSDKTAEKVLNAARTLNLKRILPPSHHRILRIEALLARPELPLIAHLNREFTRQSERIDKSVIIQRTILKSDNPNVVARAIDETKCDGLVMYTQDHPLIHAAIERTRDRGVPLICIFSDLPESKRLAYAGINHYSAGRMAGQVMAWAIKEAGPIIALCHHFGFLAHADRVRGLQDGLAEYAPHLSVTEVLEGGDDSNLSEILLRRCFQSHVRVAGVYNVGAANLACGRAIKAILPDHPPIFIGHELTDDSRELLRDGTMTLAIDQYPEQQARFAIDVLMHHFGYTETKWLEPPYPSNTTMRLFTRENLAT